MKNIITKIIIIIIIIEIIPCLMFQNSIPDFRESQASRRKVAHTTCSFEINSDI